MLGCGLLKSLHHIVSNGRIVSLRALMHPAMIGLCHTLFPSFIRLSAMSIPNAETSHARHSGDRAVCLVRFDYIPRHCSENILSTFHKGDFAPQCLKFVF